MLRREFLCAAGGGALAGKPPSVLVHEHVLVDFVGADHIRPGRYNRDEVFRIARPKLDSGWYHVGEPGGGDFRRYTYLYTDFLAAARSRRRFRADVGEPARGVRSVAGF